jgi:soluble lytic murein transglycosylase-like protein
MYSKVVIKYPDINRAYAPTKNVNYSQQNVISANTNLLKSVYSVNKSVINKWGEIFDIDNSIIASFIVTESNGTDAPPNRYGATGIMQMTAPAVWETLVKWKAFVGSDLPSQAKEYFEKVLPESKNFNPNVLPSASLKSKITNLLQKDRTFSIACGVANLRWLLEAYSNNFTSPINKVMVSYNAGYYGMRNKVKGSPTTESMVLNKSIPIESRSYLLKMLGKNGFVQLYFDNKLNEL